MSQETLNPLIFVVSVVSLCFDVSFFGSEKHRFRCQRHAKCFLNILLHRVH